MPLGNQTTTRMSCLAYMALFLSQAVSPNVSSKNRDIAKSTQTICYVESLLIFTLSCPNELIHLFKSVVPGILNKSIVLQ